MVEEEVVVKSKENNNESLVKYILGGAFFISIMILVGMYYADGTSLKWAIWLVIVTGFFFLVGLFGKKIWEIKKKFTENENINVNAISDKEARDLIEEKLKEESWTYIERGTIPKQYSKHINSNEIRIYYLKISSEEEIGGKMDDRFIAIINATYPKKVPIAILPIETPDEEISEIMNGMASNPKDDPDVIERVVRDSFGNEVGTTKEIIHRKREEENKEASVV